MANKINFSANGAPTRRLKVAPTKFQLSPGRPNISMSDGVRPAFPLMPYRHLPESFMDINTQDWVVIPKGRIVSAITSNDGDLGDGLEYFGVPKGIMGLIVPANGGAARTVTSPVLGAGDKVIPANFPIGVAEHDVYQDMRGENLNYDMRSKNYGVLARQLIKLPSVDVGALDTFLDGTDLFCDTSEGAPVATGLGVTHAYFAVEPKYSWLTIKEAADGVSGTMLKSDFYGNYMPGTTANQVVGRLLGVDYRFNKDMLDTVQSVYEETASYRVSGTGTMGIPQFLYDYAYAALSQALIKATTSWAAATASDSVIVVVVGGEDVAMASKDPAEIVALAISEGAFGEAWIQINI